MKKFLYFSLIVLLGLGCNKSKDDITITGKWYVRGLELNEFYSGTSHYSSETPTPGAYIELKSDGTVFAVSISSFSTGTWVKNGNSLILTTSSGLPEEWIIKKHTGSDLEIYNTDKDLFPTDYYEVTVYLNR